MWFRGECYSQRNWSDLQKIEFCIKTHETLSEYYQLINKLVILAIKREWKLVIENPYSHDHYLTRYFPIRPALIDKDRSRDGDYFKKPTQFWFINFKPECNLVLEPIELVKRKRVGYTHDIKERSEIHPQYARRFIKQYIIDEVV